MERNGEELYFNPDERRLLPGKIPASIAIKNAIVLSELLEKEALDRQSRAMSASGFDPEYCRGELANSPQTYQIYELGRLIHEALFKD